MATRTMAWPVCGVSDGAWHYRQGFFMIQLIDGAMQSRLCRVH